MRILIIDGQSGRIGACLAEELKHRGVTERHEVIGVGTNALATAAMLKAGVSAGATGENAAVVQAKRADIITGPIGILLADSLLGEITPAISVAVGQSEAVKIPVPVNRCACRIVGADALTRTQLIEAVCDEIERMASPKKPEIVQL